MWLLSYYNKYYVDRDFKWSKLQFGEYVSLGKVESVLKGCPLINDICIYGDPTKSYVVALVCPARPALAALANRFGKSDLAFNQLCQDKDITGGALREITTQVNFVHLLHFQCK